MFFVASGFRVDFRSIESIERRATAGSLPIGQLSQPAGPVIKSSSAHWSLSFLNKTGRYVVQVRPSSLRGRNSSAGSQTGFYFASSSLNDRPTRLKTRSDAGNIAVLLTNACGAGVFQN